MNSLHKLFYREQLVVRKKQAEKDEQSQDRGRDFVLVSESHLFLGCMFRYVEQIALKTRCNASYFNFIASFLHERSKESQSLVESIAHSFFIDLVHYENNERELLSVIYELIDQNLPQSYLLEKLLNFYTRKKSQRKFLKLVFKKELEEILINQDNLKDISFDPQTIYEAFQYRKYCANKLRINRNYVKWYNLDTALQDWEVERTLGKYSDGIIRHTRNIIDELVRNFKSVPQGIRGICQKLYQASQSHKVVCEFLFYKWWLPALVDPVNYEILHSISLHKYSIKYLLKIAAIIRHVCNNTRFHERGHHFINQFIQTKVAEVQNFIKKLTSAEGYKKKNHNNTLGLPEKHIELMNEIDKFKVISVVLSLEDILYIASIIRGHPEAFGDPQWKRLVKFSNILNSSKLCSMIKTEEKSFLYFSQIEWGNSFSEENTQVGESAAILGNAVLNVEEANYIKRSQELIKRVLIMLDFSSITVKDMCLEGILRHTKECSYAYEGKKAYQSNQSLPLLSQFLRKTLEKIPPEYSEDGFSLLYQEMILDIDHRFKNLSKDLKLNRKILLLALECTQKHVNDVKTEAKMKFKTNLFEIINSFEVNACIISKMNQSDTQLRVVSTQECPHSRMRYMEDLINEQYLEDKNQVHTGYINEFPLAFGNSDYVRDCCRSNNYANIVRQAFFMYVDLVRKKLDAPEKIVERIEHFLTISLYPYVFPEGPSAEDCAFYSKTLELNWIQPEHLGIAWENDEIWNFSVACVERIDKEKNPMHKLDCLEQCFNAIKDMLTLLSDCTKVDPDESFSVSVYILLKAKPLRLFSNFYFIETFTDHQKYTDIKSFVFYHFQRAALFIKDMNEKRLNMSLEEYQTNCGNSRSSTEIY